MNSCITKQILLGALFAMQFLNGTHAAVPIVNWSRPTNGASVAAGTILLRATVTDSDGFFSRLDFFAGTNLVRRVSGTLSNGTYNAVWSNAPAGTFQLHAEAADTDGNQGVSESVQITVTTVPVVNLTRPTNGAVVAAGTILLTASATDADGTITFVDFFASSTSLGRVYSPSTNGLYNLVWANASPGMYQMRAEAVDNLGIRGVSASAQVAVTGVTNPPPTNCVFTIDPPLRAYSSASSTAEVHVNTTPGCNWDVVNTNGWITCAIVTNGSYVDVTVAQNTDASRRTGMVLIAEQTHTVIQNPPPCTFAISPTNASYNAAGGTDSVSLTTSSGCGWTISNSNTWITVVPSSTNVGSGTVNYSVAANPNPVTRSGVIRIASRLFYISQAGNCTLTLSPDSASFSADSATGLVSVTTATGCAWSAVETNSWITIVSPLSGSGTGTVVYALTDNSTPVTRTGYITIGGQVFTVTQMGTPLPPAPPVVIPPVEVTTIGHRFGSNVVDYLIDQDQSSGGGAVLPNVSVDWDTNNQFSLTVSAPQGMKFVVNVPPGRLVRFGGFLLWESTGGGFSGYGPVTASFTDLEGTAPNFDESDSVLSDSHGYFGFVDVVSTWVTNSFAFTSLTLTGTVSPQYTGNGTEDYTPHSESFLQLAYSMTGTNDPGSFVSLEPTGAVPRILVVGMSPEGGFDLRIFGRPGRTHIVECSPDTVKWIQINTVVMAPAGSVQVKDASASTADNRFYRVVEMP